MSFDFYATSKMHQAEMRRQAEARHLEREARKGMKTFRWLREAISTEHTFNSRSVECDQAA